MRSRNLGAKVLHRLDGRPLINHVLRTARLAPQGLRGCRAQGGDVRTAVLEELNEEYTEFVLQQEQLGTGTQSIPPANFLRNQDSTLLDPLRRCSDDRRETLATYSSITVIVEKSAAVRP